MSLIVPFGFYGWGNIGDEATLQGFATLLSRFDRSKSAWVASRDPAHTARVEPRLHYYHAVQRGARRWWAELRATGALVAGGTPIMDILGEWPLCEVAPLVRAATDKRQPFAFVGCGTESLHRDESRRVVSTVLAPRVTHWSVRSAADQRRLCDYGVSPDRITVAADMAWLLEPVAATVGRSYLTQLGVQANRFTVGVNVNLEASLRERHPRLLESLSELLDGMIEQEDAQILFLCNEVRDGATFDAATSREVIAHMRHSRHATLVPNHYWTPQQMLSFIACCDLTVSTRYHFCLFSALQGVPFFAVKRSDKVDDLCRDLDWEYGAQLADFDQAHLLERLHAIGQSRQSLVVMLAQRTETMKRRALLNGAALEVLR